jgi:hypothetical protein
LVSLPLHAVRPEITSAYYDLRHFVDFDAVVTTRAVSDRYRASPLRYPVHNRFYDDLDSYCDLLRVVIPGSGVRGAEIRIYRPSRAGARRLLTERGPLTETFPEEHGKVQSSARLATFCRSLVDGAWAAKDYPQSGFYARVMARYGGGEVRLEGLDLLYRAQLLDNRTSEAEHTLREYLRDRPADAVALACLARIHEARGEVEPARQLYQRAVAVDREGRVRWVRDRLRGLP